MKTTTTLFLCLLVLFSISQQKISFTVLFPSDCYSLTPTAKQRIDSLVKALPNTPKAYSVALAGHTDNEGDLDYNEALSDRRSETVRKYLLRKGFSKSIIAADGFAYLQPVAPNEEEIGKAKNRRVQVSLSSMRPDLSKFTDKTSVTMNYTFKHNEEALLSYPSGSKMRIPSNAFVHADGSPVSGSVTIQYTEYRNVADFMATDIPMSFKDDKGEFVQFNSAGMFKIEAYNNNKKLQLKPSKRIDLNFVKTGEVPDMQIFKYNERSRRWRVETPPAANVNISAKNNFVRGNIDGCATTYQGRDYCTLWPESAVELAIRVGHKLSHSNNPVYLKRARQYFVKTNFKMPTYRVQITERRSKNIKFRLLPESNFNSEIDFGVFEWTYTSHENFPFKDSWEEGIWLRVKIEYLTEKDFYLTMFRNEEEVRMLVKGKIDNHYLRKSELKAFYRNNQVTNLKYILNDKPQSEDFADIIADSPERRLRDNRCGDSLFCFYQWSKRWMPDSSEEKALGFRAWLDYFNLNKEMMQARYSHLLSNKDSILTAVKADRESARIYQELMLARTSDQAGYVSSLVQAVGITELGVWNCDQIYRLQEPMMVEKTYGGKDGKKIEPISIFVIDPAVNGVLTFNGNYGMSPYKFQVSSKSNNTLIAFDDNNNAFYCSPSVFANAISKDKSVIPLLAVDKKQLEELLRGEAR